MKTKAAILYHHNSPLVKEEIEIPKLKDGQVLVKMLASGICRSQLNEIAGLKGTDRYLPHLLGHEGSGIIEAVGTRVTKVKSGDYTTHTRKCSSIYPSNPFCRLFGLQNGVRRVYVVVSWIKGSGLDEDSSKYKANRSIINSGPVATFSKYAVISENRVNKIPTQIQYDRAALIGCALSTGAGIVRHKFHLTSLSTLGIIGVGDIGSSVILGATIYHPHKIIAIDINPAALQFAQKIGATHTLRFNPKTFIREMQKISSGGVDYIVEASGSKIAMEKTLDIMKQFVSIRLN